MQESRVLVPWYGPPHQPPGPPRNHGIAMHLLHVGTRRLEQFVDPVPAYAVLSHTWGAEEVTFQEVRAGGAAAAGKRGHAKLLGCCAQAARDGLDYVWIDTCCIDKTSSAELSEAINSMFAWYARARVCYVYLDDVPATDRPARRDSAFRRSRWFTRGWTLQELIAPRARRFFARSWDPVRFAGLAGGGGGGGDDGDGVNDAATLAFGLPCLLEAITGVPQALLSPGFADVAAFSVAERLAWAAGRATSRPEDRAYCLLGLLGVNMPLLYGEGGARAFFRLQQEILQNSADQTLLCWASSRLLDPDDQLLAWTGALAPGPDLFMLCSAHCREDEGRPLVTARWAGQPSQPDICLPVEHSLMTNRGLFIHMPVHVADKEQGVILAAVDVYHCRQSRDRLALPLVRSRHSSNVFYRLPGGRPIRLAGSPCAAWDRKWIYLGLQDHCPDKFAPVGSGDDFWWVDVTGPLCSSDGPWRFDGLYPWIPAARQGHALRLGYARLVELPDDLLLAFSNPSATILVWLRVASTTQWLRKDGGNTLPLVKVSIAQTEGSEPATSLAEPDSQRVAEAPIAYVLEPGCYRVDFQRALARYEWSDARESGRAPQSAVDSSNGSFEQTFDTALLSMKFNIQLA